jgi:hypothetical protein
MRHLLSRLGFRVAAVLAIVLFIAGAVAVGRVVGHAPAPPGDISGGDLTPPPTVAVSGTSTADDDGVRTPPPTLPAADAGPVRTRVDEFMAAWLSRSLSPEAWHAGVAKLSTATLAKSLVGVDPLSVPATRVTAPPTFPVLTATFAQAVIEVDSGTVTLSLLKNGAEWLVDGIDWARA